MLELGADQSGKISYQEFLQKRLALKPEIDALRKKTADYQLTSSDMSLGRYAYIILYSNFYLGILRVGCYKSK